MYVITTRSTKSTRRCSGWQKSGRNRAGGGGRERISADLTYRNLAHVFFPFKHSFAHLTLYRHDGFVRVRLACMQDVYITSTAYRCNSISVTPIWRVQGGQSGSNVCQNTDGFVHYLLGLYIMFVSQYRTVMANSGPFIRYKTSAVRRRIRSKTLVML